MKAEKKGTSTSTTRDYPEDQLVAREQKIADWFYFLDDLYSRTHGRGEGVAEGEGFDPEPDKRPCEHRRQWMAGNLCLACDNTGWRRCAAGEEGVDPYSKDIKTSVSTPLPVVLEGRQLDQEIDRLEHLASVREGSDLVEDRQTRQYRLVAHKGKTLSKILRTLQSIRLHAPDFHPLTPEGLRLMAMTVPGRIVPAPR